MSCVPIHKSESTELFQENVRLKQKIEEFRQSDASGLAMKNFSIEKPMKNPISSYCQRFGRYVLKYGLIWVLAAMITTIVAVYLMTNSYKINLLTMEAKLNAKPNSNAQSYSAVLGQASDPEIQECLRDVSKKTFPDLDYALFGYNIIRGYPLAVGHDPGLTRPIFKSDYSSRRQTADCRYSLPKGLIVVPDVSCVTSFSSDVILDAYQLSKSLSGYASVSGGGWGVSFAASAGYKKRTAEVSSKETVYVNSQAKCDYYLSTVDEMDPPLLTSSFVKRVKTLETESDFFKFFDYYGTHFMTEVTFGARFMYENKMSKHSFKEQSQSSVSVEAQASYSGVVRVGASAGLSLEEQNAAKKFQSKVETSTISVGAPPPASGSTLQWASTVKENPVPTKYKLVSIENLFTKKYMVGTGIDYDAMYKRILTTKGKYCKYLKERGIVNTCQALESYTQFHDVKLGPTYYRSIIGDLRSCTSSCLQETTCVALSHTGKACFMYDSTKVHWAENVESSMMVLLIDRINILDVDVEINNVYVSATARTIEKGLNATDCKQRCRSDTKCIAYTAPFTGTNCKLYQQNSITEDSIKYNAESFMVFQTNKTISS